MNLIEKRFYEFGPFRVDTEERVLLREGRPVQLAPKVFDTLLILVQRQGQIVAKEMLMRELWPDTFVEEGNLTFNISMLRKVLGEDKREPQYIETVPRRGYRFLAGVKETWANDGEIVLQERTHTSIVIEEETQEASAHGLNKEQQSNDIALERSAIASLSSQPALKDMPRRAILLTSCFVLIASLVIGSYIFISRSKQRTQARTWGHELKFSKLSFNGKVAGAAISPDGRHVAYISQEGAKQSVWLRQVATEAGKQILPFNEARHLNLKFSRDGDHLYFLKIEKGEGFGAIYKLSALGGVPTQLITNSTPDFAISPDDARVAFVRYDRKDEKWSLLVANADGTGERKLISHKMPQRIWALAWSPDGKIIACAVGHSETGENAVNIVGVNVEDGAEKNISPQRWFTLTQCAWESDGSGLLITARDQKSSSSQFWRLSYPDGEIRKVTNDLNDYGVISVKADSTEIVTVQAKFTSHIWVTSNGNAAEAHAKQLARSAGGLSWTPDGKIVYATFAKNNDRDIWTMNSDGTDQRQLTLDKQVNRAPSVSPDGRYIVFASNRAGTLHIWRMEADGSNPTQITNGGGENEPFFSPDGRWVIYNAVDFWTLWKVPIEGGQPVQITQGKTMGAAISPDGKWFAYFQRGPQPNALVKIVVIPFEGGPAVKEFAVSQRALPTFDLSWTKDGKALIYAADSDDISNLWRQPLNGRYPERITNFNALKIFEFALSPDEKQIAIARGEWTNELVLISGLK
jgi:Tol biopolymer transport system component/DNA-binding winged helix-turn-helix (wHTH) protein